MDKFIDTVIKEIPLLAKTTASEITIKKLSGLSNQNYLLTTPEQQFILRIPRNETNIYINRENEAVNHDISTHLDIAPKTYWRNKAGISLTEYIQQAKNLTQADLNDTVILTQIAKSLKRLYDSNKTFSGNLSARRIKKLLNHYYHACSSSNQLLLEKNYLNAIQTLDKLTDDHRLVPSHIDLIPENILLQEKKLWLIDWEYAAMASPFWDIAMLCNHGNLDHTKRAFLLDLLLENVTENDRQQLQHYQYIVQCMSECWLRAFTPI